jgi:hypothetical protein
MKLKIISDGTSRSTRVVNAETGEELNKVVSISITMSVLEGCRAIIVVDDPVLEISGLDFGIAGQTIEAYSI